jgi:hypothetical protein
VVVGGVVVEDQVDLESCGDLAVDRPTDAAEASLAVDELDLAHDLAGGLPRLRFGRPVIENRGTRRARALHSRFAGASRRATIDA